MSYTNKIKQILSEGIVVKNKNNTKVDGVKYIRKPGNWSDEFGSTQKVHYDKVKHLPHYKSHEVYGGSDPAHPLVDFKKSMPQHFIMTHKGSHYAVNTEGHDYARYAARISVHGKPIKEDNDVSQGVTYYNKPKNNIEKAWNAGVDARRRSKPMVNPHHPQTYEHTAWHQGYQAEHEENHKW